MNRALRCFKAYDIRGQVPTELDESLAHRIGRAFVEFLGASRIALGRDVRVSSQSLSAALSRGLREAGADVLDIGVCSTEEVYFATIDRALDGGIAVTASHNPRDYNGFKLVARAARPVSSDSGLREIERLVLAGRLRRPRKPGHSFPVTDNRQRFVAFLRGYLCQPLQPLRIVVNAGNGTAGLVLDALEPYLPFHLLKLHHEPDGSFPNGIPNPLLPERRDDTAAAVRSHSADLGIAWDGDADRCFFFDEQGEFIQGYYLVGVLAEEVLQRSPGGKVIYDPRLTWNTVEMVRAAQGVPVQSKSGHAFIKERMRCEDAVYGGEMSAHHYFRDFGYCDSGMIPWLLLTQRLSRTGQTMSAMFDARMQAFPCSGEINFEVTDPNAVIEKVLGHYAHLRPELDRTDGIGLSFGAWRMNLRASNTEPLLRLNVEARGDGRLLAQRTAELRSLIAAVAAA